MPGIIGENRKINDHIPRKLPRGTFVVHKTGAWKGMFATTWGFVFTNKGNFLICVLAKHKDKYAQPTKKFISDITLLTYNYFQNLE